MSAAAWLICALSLAGLQAAHKPASHDSSARDPSTQNPSSQAQSLDELPLEGARDMSGEGRAFVETVIDGDSFYIQQPIHVRLRFGVERQFLEKDMLQLFRRPLDVPVQLQAPWFESLSDTFVRKASAAAEDDAARARHLSFAFDEAITNGAHLENTSIDGSTFTVLEIETTWLPTVVGKLSVPAPIVRFAFATGFHDDTWTGRVPSDRHDAYVKGPPRTLSILPFPDQGRPPEFNGAIGHFTIQAEASPLELVAGGSLKLTLKLVGEGNLELLTAPPIEAIEGFKLLGQVDATTNKQQPTFVYDLAPESEDVVAIPSISFAYFDPSPPASYRLAHTHPIPIEVHKRRGGGSGKADGSGSIDPVLWVGALVLASLLIVLGVRLRRKKPESRESRVYDAALAFTNRVEEDDVDLERAFVDFLAVVLDCASPAVVGLRLEERLIDAGVPDDLAARSTALLERLTVARLGGKPAFESKRSVSALVDALDRSIQEPAK